MALIFIGLVVFNEVRPPFLYEYYIVNFENTKAQLTESEKNDLIKLLRLEKNSFEEPYFIEITKIAYDEGPDNGVSGYIFFRTNINNVKRYISGSASIKNAKNENEYIYERIEFGKGSEEYQIIKNTVIRHYNWFGKKEKKLDIS